MKLDANVEFVPLVGWTPDALVWGRFVRLDCDHAASTCGEAGRPLLHQVRGFGVGGFPKAADVSMAGMDPFPTLAISRQPVRRHSPAGVIRRSSTAT